MLCVGMHGAFAWRKICPGPNLWGYRLVVHFLRERYAFPRGTVGTWANLHNPRSVCSAIGLSQYAQGRCSFITSLKNQTLNICSILSKLSDEPVCGYFAMSCSKLSMVALSTAFINWSASANDIHDSPFLANAKIDGKVQTVFYNDKITSTDTTADAWTGAIWLNGQTGYMADILGFGLSGYRVLKLDSLLVCLFCFYQLKRATGKRIAVNAILLP